MTGPEEWRQLTIFGLLQRAAQRWPERRALVSPTLRLTYRELLRLVGEIAADLRDLGIGPGDRVATLSAACGEWVCLQYALGAVGAVVIPLNTRLRAAELRYALATVRAAALVVHRDRSLDPWNQVVEACPELADETPGGVQYAALPHLRRLICSGPAASSSASRLALAPHEREGVGSPTRLAIEPWPADPAEAAVILLTSGSTGQPKAAMLSHTNLIGHAHYLSAFLGLTCEDRYLNLLPFFHVAGYTQSILASHYAGSALILTESFAAAEAVEAIVNERITAWAAMPVTVERVLDHARQTGASLSSLRVQHGVSPELWDRVERETGAQLLTRMYGLTESGGLVSMTAPDTPGPRRRESVGSPLPGVDLRVIDPATGAKAPPGAPGEVIFAGWNRFLGYFDEPQLTAQTIDSAGFCHTGDRGYVDAAGRLHLLGRYKEIVKTGGENVSPAEVEAALAALAPSLRAVRVVGVPDPIWGEAVTAVVEVNPADPLRPAEVIARCRGQMASFKVPKHVLIMQPGEWPLTSSGKIDAPGLRRWAMDRLAIS
jgi:fatty-acyl-CoA synthase